MKKTQAVGGKLLSTVSCTLVSCSVSVSGASGWQVYCKTNFSVSIFKPILTITTVIKPAPPQLHLSVCTCSTSKTNIATCCLSLLSKYLSCLMTIDKSVDAVSSVSPCIYLFKCWYHRLRHHTLFGSSTVWWSSKFPLQHPQSFLKHLIQLPQFMSTIQELSSAFLKLTIMHFWVHAVSVCIS